LKDDILFLGKQKNISDLLSISDLKLLLSNKESFGLVLLEAMTCEVPCVGTNVGGIPEVIKNNQTGYLDELGDIESEANYAIQLLENDALLERFSQNAFLYAQKQFNSQKIMRQYIDLYDDVLSNK